MFKWSKKKWHMYILKKKNLMNAWLVFEQIKQQFERSVVETHFLNATYIFTGEK